MGVRGEWFALGVVRGCVCSQQVVGVGARAHASASLKGVLIPGMQSDRDRVLEATDLVALIGEHVALRQKGREHVGLCPFHEDRTPSLAVVTHKDSSFYKCFACGAAGNAIDFMMNYHRMEFPEALRTLAARAGVELRRYERDRDGDDDPRTSRMLLRRANQVAQKFFRQTMADGALGAKAQAVVAARTLPSAMVERFALGAAPDGWDHFVRHLDRLDRHGAGAGGESSDSIPRAAFEAAGLVRSGSRGPIDGFRNRLMFPICDELGNTIAFGARKIDPEDEPKYLNSPESAIFHKGRSLYGLHLARRAIIEHKLAIICEGYTDCMACHEAGFEHSVATLGTSLTREHARLLQRLAERVVLLFDGDEAGQRAADRAVEVFFAEPIDVLICTLPDGLDPDELLRQDRGAERFREAIEGAVDAVTYQVRRFEAQWRGASGLSGRQQRLEAMLARLSELGLAQTSGLRKRLVLGSLADLTGLRVEEMERALASQKRPARSARGAAPSGGVAESAAVNDGAANSSIAVAPSPRQRARVEAERNLLALLLAEPGLAHESLPSEDGALPILEAFSPSTFVGARLQTIAGALWSELESGNRPTLQTVMADLTETVDKSLASDLFSLGSKRLDPSSRPERAAPEAVREAAIVLDRIVRRETIDSARPISDAPLTTGTLMEALDRLRRQGPNPSAIARASAPSSLSPRPGL